MPTPSECLKKAGAHINKLVDVIREVIAVSEMNRHLVYSTHLSKQVSHTEAAHAYNVLQFTTFRYELLRLASCWDRASSERDSIPSVITLLDQKPVLIEVETQIRNWNAPSAVLNPSKDLKLRALEAKALFETQAQWAKEDVATGKLAVKAVLDKAKAIRDGDLLRALRQCRDRMIAHNLTIPVVSSGPEIDNLKYGNEKLLLNETVSIVQKLHLWINGKDFDIEGEVTQNRSRQANAFWQNLVFVEPKRV